VGKYSFSGDTIMLTYSAGQFKEFDPNEILTRKVLIDQKYKRVRSVDNRKQFCAGVNLDERMK